MAEAKGCGLADLDLTEFRRVVPGIGPAVYKVLDIDRSVASRRSLGGTAPVRVRQAIAAARKRLLG
jgi:argininosuccinate lyase